MATLADQYEALARGVNRDPFRILGPHCNKSSWTVRTWQPHADTVELLSATGQRIAALKPVGVEGVFEVRRPLPEIPYRLRINQGGHEYTIADPYAFDSPLGELDRYLMKEGSVQRLEQKLGANFMVIDDIPGVHFAVWAPDAGRVSVVGNFNCWNGLRHPMRFHPENGIWDIFIPHLQVGDYYKFELLDASLNMLPVKADPFARQMEAAPGNASIVYSDNYQWQDGDWLARQRNSATFDQPISIYEVHLGSWQRDAGNHPLGYRQLADELAGYVTKMGFTHVELLPVSEHPFSGSWGYQPVGLFAPTNRFGSPEDFKYFVDTLHRHAIGVIIDWVPAHFPRDDFGLGRFDGTHLYEHADPRQGAHPDWGTLIFNFSRREVVNYLIANATFWIEEYHIDGLRVDAVASMLYLDYSREDGQWVPNRHGGNENLEAAEFLKLMNQAVHACGGITIAEESTAWPGVSHPVYDGGLGFSYKWNMGWMNDTLKYFSEDPLNRKFHAYKITFGIMYAFSENFVLPLSHDEVVHGKGSILTRMPGDHWQSFANLRLYYTFMFSFPGKKLLFMGNEFGQRREWNHDSALDWPLLDEPEHLGVQHLVRELNTLYRQKPALHELDCQNHGFSWIDFSDAEQCVFSFVRRAKNPDEFVVVVCNMTPVVRHDYRIGVPASGSYSEIFNSDLSRYGGSGVFNDGSVTSEDHALHGFLQSIELTLPPLGVLALERSEFTT